MILEWRGSFLRAVTIDTSTRYHCVKNDEFYSHAVNFLLMASEEKFSRGKLLTVCGCLTILNLSSWAYLGILRLLSSGSDAWQQNCSTENHKTPHYSDEENWWLAYFKCMLVIKFHKSVPIHGTRQVIKLFLVNQ